MRFQAFAITSDVLTCHGPWEELGWSFRVHRFGSGRHRRLLRDAVLTDHALAKALARVVDAEVERERSRLQTHREVKTIATNGAAPEIPPAPEAEPEASLALPDFDFEGEYRLSKLERYRDALEKGDLAELERLSPDYAMRELVVSMLDGWEGVKDDAGAEVPFTPENARDLLLLDQLVPDDREYGGRTLGEALTRHLFDRMRGHAAAAATYVDEAGKGSPAASAGG